MLFYLNRNNDVKRFNCKKYFLSKCIIKNYNVIINGKSFYGQLIIPNTKWYEEIMNLTTSQNKGYHTGCLLDYDNVMIMISR